MVGVCVQPHPELVDESDACGHSVVDCHGLRSSVRVRSYTGSAPFFWWPLYPIGYAISGTWAVNFFWFSVFISYFIKLAILRFGGVRTFRRVATFLFGVDFGRILSWECLGTARYLLGEADVSVYLVRESYLPFFT